MSTADGDTVTVLSTRFAVRAEALAGYPVQTVDTRMRQEPWIPAEALDAMNAAIAGRIEVIAEFRGERTDDGGSGG